MAVGFGSSNSPAVLGNQPGTHNYLNSQALGNLALTMPDFFPTLIQRYGRQEISNILKWIPGFHTSSSGAEIIRHAEEDYIMGKIKAEAHIAGAAGVAVTLTISASDVAIIPQTLPYAGAGNGALDEERVTPIFQDQVQFKNGVYAVVSAVDEANNTFTVIPLSATDVIPAIVNGQNNEIAITGSFAEERSGAKVSKSSRMIYYENYMGHTRADYTVSSRAAGEPIWVQVPDRNGKMTDMWFMKGISDTYQRLMNQVDLMHLDGKVVTNPAVALIPGLKTIQRTLGLIQTVEASGNVETYTSGAMTLTDVENMLFAFSRNKAPKDFLGICGLKFRKDFGALIRGGAGLGLDATNTTGSIIFNQFDGKKKQGISLDFQYLEYLGYNLALKTAEVFQDGQTLGLVDKYSKLCLFVPLGQTTAYDYDNPASKVEVPTIRLVEKDNGLGTIGYSEWMTGHAPKFNVATSSFQELNVHMEYSAALEVFAINRFGLMEAE